MANLPNRPFLINYNARTFDTATTTFAKTEGQLFNRDFPITYHPQNITAHTEDGYLSIDGANGRINFSSTDDNPFNRYNTDTGRSITIVYKTSSLFNGGNLLHNRNGDYNFMVRDTFFHTSESNFLPFEPSQTPCIMYIRVAADGTCERKCVTTGQIATASTIAWGGASSQIGLFAGYVDGAELFTGDFYWLYVSNDALTDSEIAQVIAYNENSSVFYADPDSLSFGYEASSSTITLNADTEMSWTATSVPSWITLSNSAGTGTATITVSAAQNNTISPRTSTIVFSNGEDTAEVECTQAKHPLLVPFNNIYRNGLIN